MNILYLTTHLNTGGITTYLLTLSKGLVQDGHRVFIGSSGGNMLGEFTTLGVEHFELNIQTKSELDWRIYACLNKVGKFIRDNDIQVIHANTRVTQVMGTLLRYLTGVPYVSTCHGFFKPRLSRRIFPCWGDKAIAISPAVRQHLLDDFKVRLERVEKVESGVDLENFKPFSAGLRRQNRKILGLSDKDIILGMVARLSDVKGQDILIQALPDVIQEFDQVKLLLVGEGKKEEDFKRLVAELGMTRHVIFFNDVNEAKFYLSVFDVYVNPSRQEGLGLSVMEAQACGLPVVASNVGGIPTLISSNKTGFLVESENPRALALKIISVLKDFDSAIKIGQQARQFIKDNYSEKQMVQKTISVYQSLLGK